MQLQFQKAHDFGAEDFGNKVIKSGSHYYVAGSSTSNASSTYDAVLQRTDEEGTDNGGGQLDFGGAESGSDICRTSTGEVILVGRSNALSTSPAGVNDMLVLRLNSGGEPAWVQVFGSDSTENAQDVVEGNDGHIVIVGQSKRRSSDRTDAMVVKLDSADGSIIWAKEIGSEFINEGVHSIVATGDGYVIGGWSGANVIGLNEGFIMGLSESGEKDFVAFIGGPGDDEIKSVVPGTVGDYIFVVGNTRDIGAGGGDVFVGRIDANSQPPALNWFKTYGSTGNESLQQAIGINGKIVMTGTTNGFGNGQEGFLLQIDEDGNIDWSNVYGGAQDDYLQGVTSDDNGGFLAVGYSNSFAGTGNDIWIVNVDASGNSTCSQTTVTFATESISIPSVARFDFMNVALDDITSTDVTLTPRQGGPDFGGNPVTTNTLCLTVDVADVNENVEFGLYPIPTDNVLNVTFPSDDVYNVSIYAVDGRVVYSGSFSGLNSRMSVEHLVAGVYVLEAVSEKGKWTSKVLKN